MNRIQATLLISSVFDALSGFAKKDEKVNELQIKAQEFFNKNAKNKAKEGEFEDLQLNAKDKKTYQSMRKEIKEAGNPKQIIEPIIKSMQKVVSDPVLNDVKHEIKSHRSPSDLAEAINELEDTQDVISLKYFTGTSENVIVYCCGVEYLKKKHSK